MINTLSIFDSVYIERAKARFFAKVKKNAKDAPVYKGTKCWLWTGGLWAGGYGCFSLGGRSECANRVMWLFKHKNIPEDLWVLHHCDNRACVNPKHLWLGNALDNNRDMMTKGRYVNGIAGHPELCIHGDKHWTHLHPEKLKRGAQHWSNEHPEKRTVGSANGSAKLTEQQVRTIRSHYFSGRFTTYDLADKYGVTSALISRIVRYVSWKHVA